MTRPKHLKTLQIRARTKSRRLIFGLRRSKRNLFLDIFHFGRWNESNARLNDSMAINLSVDELKKSEAQHKTKAAARQQTFQVFLRVSRSIRSELSESFVLCVIALTHFACSDNTSITNEKLTTQNVTFELVSLIRLVRES